MELTITAWYKDAAALYTISENNGYMMATLQNYSGAVHNTPPSRLNMISNGRTCKSEAEDQQLVDAICKAITEKVKLQAQDPLFPETVFRKHIVDNLV
jgi:hypothetical protein